MPHRSVRDSTPPVPAAPDKCISGVVTFHHKPAFPCFSEAYESPLTVLSRTVLPLGTSCDFARAIAHRPPCYRAQIPVPSRTRRSCHCARSRCFSHLFPARCESVTRARASLTRLTYESFNRLSLWTIPASSIPPSAFGAARHTPLNRSLRGVSAAPPGTTSPVRYAHGTPWRAPRAVAEKVRSTFARSSEPSTFVRSGTLAGARFGTFRMRNERPLYG